MPVVQPVSRRRRSYHRAPLHMLRRMGTGNGPPDRRPRPHGRGEAGMTATTTATPRLVDPVAEARGIGPLLREHAPQADRDARLPAASVQALRDRGFFRLY